MWAVYYSNYNIIYVLYTQYTLVLMVTMHCSVYCWLWWHFWSRQELGPIPQSEQIHDPTECRRTQSLDPPERDRWTETGKEVNRDQQVNRDRQKLNQDKFIAELAWKHQNQAHKVPLSLSVYLRSSLLSKRWYFRPFLKIWQFYEVLLRCMRQAVIKILVGLTTVALCLSPVFTVVCMEGGDLIRTQPLPHCALLRSQARWYI